MLDTRGKGGASSKGRKGRKLKVGRQNFYEDIASHVKARFNTSGYNHSRVRPFPVGVHWPYEGQTEWKDHDLVCGTQTEAVHL